MGLLSEIQTTLLEGGSLAIALLKMRVLAVRMQSGDLADWVRFEAEGYPHDVDLPEYRQLPVSYYGTFFGPFQSQIRNSPIPNAVIYAIIGEHALRQKITDSVAGVEHLIGMASKEGVLTTSCGDYALQLQGKIYPNYACNSVNGKISGASISEILTVVRSKLLDLTLEIESKMPEAKNIEQSSIPLSGKTQKLSQILNQVVYGNVNTVHNTGDNSTFNVNISQGNTGDVADFLARGGIAESDAKAFSEILATEKPINESEALGDKAKAWVSANIGKAMSGAWKAALPVASSLLTAAAERYYGLK